MSVIKLCAAALTATVLCIILKHNKSELYGLCAVSASIILGTAALSAAVPGIEYITSLFQSSGFGEYAEIMLKAIGIGLTVQTTSDICRDCGENAIASKLELAGKAELLLIAVPLIKYILELTTGILE